MGITQNIEPQSLANHAEQPMRVDSLAERLNDIVPFPEGSCNSCVGLIDIVNSTKVSATLTRSQVGKYYCLFINWANAVVRGYGGKVVKSTGDGLLFYFPLTEDPQDLRKVRDCLNCSIAMSSLHPNINSRFYTEGLPEVSYRISLDYGEIAMARTTDANVPDIFSTTVNVCAKINRIAAPNTVVAGGDMYRISKNLDGFAFEETKKTISIGDQPYPVYFVNHPKTIAKYLQSVKQSYSAKDASLGVGL